MKPNNPFIKPGQVTKNAGKIQNLLLQFGAEMSNTSSGYTQGGSGFESREEIAQNILNASNTAYNRLQLNKTEQYNDSFSTNEMQYMQPYYQMQQPQGVMPPYPITPPQRTNFNFIDNFTIEEDMENVDISKYIGAPKKEQQKAPQGDMGALVKEIRETNKKLEAMCKILGLIYQQNVKNNTITPADYGFNDAEPLPQNAEGEMTVEEETEMLKNLPNIPAVDPLADDESEQ